MKIAHVTPVFLPYLGGIGAACLEQARGLARLGHEVTVFTPKLPSLPRRGLGEVIDGVKVKRLFPLLKYGNGSFLPQLTWKLKGYDIVHVHLPLFRNVEFLWLAKKLGKLQGKLIIQYHHDPVLKGLTRFLGIHYKTVRDPFLKMSAKVIVSSLDFAKHSDIKGLLMRKPEKFVELPFGVDTTKFKPNKTNPHIPLLIQEGLGEFKKNEQKMLNPSVSRLRETPDPLVSRGGEKFILFVGGLDKAHYFKGLEYLLRAFAIIPEEHTPPRLKSGHPSLEGIKLVIVGNGDLRPKYESQAKELGISGKVIFAGSVSAKELLDYYNLAEVTILPSINKAEVFGIVLVESMSCGTPVIASDLPGVRTVVQDGETGYLVEPRSTKALKEKSLKALRESAKEKMGRACRQRVEEYYDSEKLAKKLENIYKS